ncbi:MAG TPA: helix-turn-helix transcriptional regulator [Dehalococcoidia bacterium]|nr:helix-turn-helix transcriptional regulator [Dehalococcoidia bacterium]
MGKKVNKSECGALVLASRRHVRDRCLGGRIRQLRDAARMTQEEPATAAGIGRVALVRIENGDRSPR